MTRKIDKSARGREGELAAAEYLREHGYLIRDRNWRNGRDEIDIVAVRGGCIRFVEVKTRDADGLTAPEEALTPAKRRAVIRAAESYLAMYGIREEPHLDLAAVDAFADGRFVVRHIPDAVECHW